MHNVAIGDVDYGYACNSCQKGLVVFAICKYKVSTGMVE